MDSINVLERAHYLTVWSRFGPYDRARLDRLVYGRRLLFEYWAHAACLVPTTTLPWWRRAMLDYRVRHTGWSDWLRRNTKVLGRVKAAVLANGPMGNADFEGRRPTGGRGGWWDWKPVQHALHYLWMTGAMTIHSRRHFHKRFDLMERAIPGVLGGEVASPEAFARWHIQRSLHAMGAATDADLAGYMTFPRFAPGARRAALRDMIADGEVVEIDVEDARVRWLALARDVSKLKRAGARAGARDDAARAVRFAALASRPGGADLRLRLPHRGLHAGAEARARLLHAADPSRRPSHRPRRREDASRGASPGGAARPLRAVVRGGEVVAGDGRQGRDRGGARGRERSAAIAREVRRRRHRHAAPRDAAAAAHAAGARARK